MHISKLLAVFCVSAIGTASVMAQRPDNDIQARARQQLREAMGELNGQAGTNAAPAPTKPVVKQPAPAPTKPAAKTPEMAPVKPKPQPQPQPNMEKPAAQKAPEMVKRPAGLSPDAEMRAREALHEAEMQTPPSGAPVSSGRVVQTRPAGPAPSKGVAIRTETKPGYTQAPPGAYNPLPTPPPQLSGSKEQRLGQLLQQYKSDQITPAQYHEQRAKIMAEP